MRAERGFTLVEVSVAVAILGLALTTLITLQTRYADNYRREREIMRAALYGQYIMTMIEVDREAPPEGRKQGDVADVLQDTGYFQDDERMVAARESELKGWRYSRQVTRIPIPPDEDALRRIDLTITWSEVDSFNLVYFMRTRQQ